MRVNARFDSTTQQQLDYLTQATGENVSHVVRESVAHYYVQVRKQQPVPSRLLALMGQGRSGRNDVASNVKREVADAVQAKHASTAVDKATPKGPRKAAR